MQKYSVFYLFIWQTCVYLCVSGNVTENPQSKEMKYQEEIIKNFLSKLSVLDYKFRLLEKDKEQFNIFSALHKENDEVRLHSRFISVLLSPISRHRKKDIFLKLFLKILSVDNFNLDDVAVYPTEYNKSEYNEIDILIINRISKQAIIIENKIGAGDSNHDDRGQLEGYYELINRLDNIPKENIKVYYLTLDGHLPSPESLGKYETIENLNGKTIDYEHEIQNWLELCLQECISQPFLRESIIQYINLIKKMTNDNTNIQERIEIRNLIASTNENMSSAKLLIENFKHVKWHTVFDFWNELVAELERHGAIIITKPTSEDITNTTHYETYKKSYETSNDYGIRFSIGDLNLYIWNAGSDWIYWGMEKKLLTPNQLEQINHFSQHNQGVFKDNGNEFWKFFELSDIDNIIFSDFSYNGTFNLINEDYRSNLIRNALVPEILSFLNLIK